MHWLSILVTFVAAVIFGILARRSPQNNWDFVRGWPAFVLLIVSGAMSQTELAQKQYERNFPRCEFVVTEEGVDCKPIPRASNPADDFRADLVDWVKGTFLSILTDTPAEFLGLALGMGSFGLAQRELEKP
jgi:hypothetical protein